MKITYFCIEDYSTSKHRKLVLSGRYLQPYCRSIFAFSPVIAVFILRFYYLCEKLNLRYGTIVWNLQRPVGGNSV
jgi:hypothetical protein